MPSVGGRHRILISVLLTGSATASGTVAGVVAAIVVAAPWALVTRAVGHPPLTATSIGLVATGAVLDLAAHRWGRPAPPTHGGQVPREWSSLLDPRVVAVLYGSRLGVGPLTILSTWGWWTSLTAAALAGVGTAVLVGATFGLVRQVITVIVSISAGMRGHIDAFAALRRRQHLGRSALNGAAALAVLAVALAGCGGSTERAHLDGSTTTSVPAVSGGERPGVGSAPSTPPPPGVDGRPRAGTPADPPNPDPTASTLPLILEDIVRPSPTGDPTGGRSAPGAASSPRQLADALPAAVAGFDPVTDPSGDRFLDLAAAAAIQPDPTEERALLETRGYRGGWIRAFRNTTNDVAVTSVYQFADAEEAEFYLQDGLILIGGYGGSFFEIEGLPGVRGFSQVVDDDGQELVTLGASFQTGDRWYLFYLLGSPASVTPETLVELVRPRFAPQPAGPAAPASATSWSGDLVHR